MTSPSKKPGALGKTLGIAARILLLAAVAHAAQAQPQTVKIPEADEGVAVLGPRHRQQLKQSQQFRVFHDFQLENRQETSGIEFRHRVVDDAGKTYKPVHYDHGNSVSVADVDGDGFYDVYFTTQIGANELWRNRGDGTFENITETAGIAVADRISVAASFADTDNDGDPDLYVTTVRMGNLFFENQGEGRFIDRTQASGLTHVGHSSGAMFFDYNLDGLVDLYLTNVGSYTLEERGRGDAWVGRTDAFYGHLHEERTEHSLLFENQGKNVFVDVTEARSLIDSSWSGDASFADLNGDLYPDLYVPDMQGDDNYFENQAGKKFVDRTEELFPRTPWGTMGIHFFDFDNDADLDLMLTDMHSDMSQDIGPTHERAKSSMIWPDDFLQGGENNIFGNALFENLGDGSFGEISDKVQTENYWPWGLSVGDLNADGWLDVFITSSMNYPFRYGINSVLLNEDGKIFRHSEFLLGVEPRPEAKAPWFDLDCSGADSEHQDCEGRDGKITVHANLGSRSSVFFDLDRDGDLDIITNEFNSLPQVLMSNLSERKKLRTLEVVLRGSASNRDGLGATVTVYAGDQRQVRYYNGKSGYLSQSSLPLYFGLGEAERIERIEVKWPSGATQTVRENLVIGSRITIQEPAQ